MPARSIVLWLVLTALAVASAVAAVAPRVADDGGTPPPHTVRAANPLIAFEPNVGQAEPGVQYVGTTPGATALVSADAIRLVLPGGARVGVQLLGTEPRAEFVGDAPLSGVSHRLIGRDASRWATAIPRFAKVCARGVYPGIDLEVHTARGRLEYDFVVAPGADAARIALAGTSAEARIVRGDLVLERPEGEVRFEKPIAYQVVRGERRAVLAEFAVRDGAIGFDLGPYDRTAPLVIDPVLKFSVVSGGVSARAVAALPDGSAVVAGQAGSPSLATDGAAQPVLAGGLDAFVTKLAPDGTIVWATYLGGTGADGAYAVALDADGNVYVAGETTSTDFPTTASAFQPTCAGYSPAGTCSTAWIAKLSADGATLRYGSYLASTFTGPVAGFEVARGVAWTGGAVACAAGFTASPGFPTTANAFQRTFGGASDAFVSCVDTGLSGVASLVYSTFLGGRGSEDATGIAADLTGRIFVAGRTDSSDLPVANAAQPSPGGSGDAFAAALDASGGLLWSTYLGGSNTDTAMAIAVDGAGNAYLTGQTKSDDFPVLHALQPGAMGGTDIIETFGDAFVTRIGLDGALAFSTYLGGLQWDWGTGIAVRDGTVHVTGNTWSLEFPVVSGAVQTRGVNQSAFVAGLRADGSTMLYSTYLGGAILDEANAIAVSPEGDVLVAGFTNSADFPVQGSPPTPLGGGAFVVRLGPGARGTSDLALGVVASVERGGIASYAFQLENRGPDTATGVTVRIYPVENTWFGIFGPLMYEFAMLEPGASAAIPIRTTPEAVGPVTVAGVAVGREADPDPSNDLAGATVAPAASDLDVAIASSPAYVAQGAEAAFTLRVTNAGPDAATDVELVAFLPPGFELASGVLPGATCAADPELPQRVVCSVASLAAVSSLDAKLVTRAYSGVRAATLSADATSMSFDPSRSTGSSATVQVVPADWAVVVDPAGADLRAGASAQLAVDVRVFAGALPGLVQLVCEGLPPSLSCAFEPADLTPGSAHATSILTLVAAPRAGAGTQARSPWPLAGVAGLLGLAGVCRRRRVVGLALAAALGCSNTSSDAGPGPPPNPTPVTHTITVKATAEGHGQMFRSERTASITVTLR